MAKQIWRGRGRPSSRMFSYKDRTVLESLAGIGIRHKVDSNEFFNRIIEAWNHERSECGQLTVRCRKRMRNSAIFLFTIGKKRERKVVAQFPISIAVLRGENQLGSYTDAILACTPPVKNLVVVTSKIADLKVGMKKVRLKAEVLEIPKSKVVYTRYGTEACVSNTLIRDETGSMKMSLWNDQIGTVHKGDVVDVRNGRVAWFSGEKQLRLGRSGSLNVARASLMQQQ
jgi:replication factor A1